MLIMLYNIINSYERQYRMEKPKYKRILVKLSGEAMRGKDGSILDFLLLEKIADALILCTDAGIEVAVMVGAGTSGGANRVPKWTAAGRYRVAGHRYQPNRT